MFLEQLGWCGLTLDPLLLGRGAVVLGPIVTLRCGRTLGAIIGAETALAIASPFRVGRRSRTLHSPPLNPHSLTLTRLCKLLVTRLTLLWRTIPQVGPLQGLALSTRLERGTTLTSLIHLPRKSFTGAPLARMNNLLQLHSLCPPLSPPRRTTRLSFILAFVPLAKRPPGRCVIFIRPVPCTTHLCTGVPDGVLSIFREATNVMTLFLCIVLRSPRKKQPRTVPGVECSVGLRSFANLGLNIVMLLNGTPETVRLKQLANGPLTPLNFRISIPRLGRRHFNTPFATRLPLKVTTLVLGPPLSMVLMNVFMFVDGLNM